MMKRDLISMGVNPDEIDPGNPGPKIKKWAHGPTFERKWRTGYPKRDDQPRGGAGGETAGAQHHRRSALERNAEAAGRQSR